MKEIIILFIVFLNIRSNAQINVFPLVKLKYDSVSKFVNADDKKVTDSLDRLDESTGFTIFTSYQEDTLNRRDYIYHDKNISIIEETEPIILQGKLIQQDEIFQLLFLLLLHYPTIHCGLHPMGLYRLIYHILLQKERRLHSTKKIIIMIKF